MPDKWEYCQLLLTESQYVKGKMRVTLGIRYFGSGSRMLSRVKGDLSRDWDVNPWEQAIAQLGDNGWELVSIQHANTAGDMGAGGELSHADTVAYFKRPRTEGRAVDEPDLKLE